MRRFNVTIIYSGPGGDGTWIYSIVADGASRAVIDALQLSEKQFPLCASAVQDLTLDESFTTVD